MQRSKTTEINISNKKMKFGSNKKIVLTVSKIDMGVTSTSKLLPLFPNLKLLLLIASLLYLQTNALYAQKGNFSFSLKGNYTSTSRYYPSSIGASAYSYEQYQSIDDIFGYGAELRYKLSDNITAGLASEHVSGVIDYRHATLLIPAKSGYDMYIFEANCYYYIPLSGETFKFYIGGGINAAKGDGYEELPGIKSNLLSSPINIGIQALSGVEYFFYKDISFRFEMKFRDPVVENENKYNSSRIFYMGKSYNISTKPFKSKINIDGIVFDLSIAYQLF